MLFFDDEALFSAYYDLLKTRLRVPIGVERRLSKIPER